jgi:hypothetical protein
MDLRITLLTDWAFLMKVLKRELSCPETRDIYVNKTDYLILDKTEEYIINARMTTDFGSILCGISGNIQGLKEHRHEIVSRGYIEKPSGKTTIPDLCIGLNPAEHPDIFQNEHSLWIAVHDEKELALHLQVRTEILAIHWLRSYLLNARSVKTIRIEDPYLLTLKPKILAKLTSILRKLREHSAEKVILVFKNYEKKRNPKTNKLERYAIKNSDQLDEWKKNIIDELGFKPEFEEADFHDRSVIINGMVFLLGHSFSMPPDTTTYVVGLDKLTYEKSKYYEAFV